MLTKEQPSTQSGEPALTVVEESAPRRSRKIQFLVYVGLLILFGLVIVFTLEWGQLWLQPHAPSPALVVKQTVSPSSVDYSWIRAGLYRHQYATKPAAAPVYHNYWRHSNIGYDLQPNRSARSDRRDCRRYFAQPVAIWVGLPKRFRVCLFE